MQVMYVKPNKGLKVRDPDLLDMLPESGRSVPQSDYWLRRLRDEDVVQADPPLEPAPQPALAEEEPAAVPEPGTESASA